jgi:heme A synthase
MTREDHAIAAGTQAPATAPLPPLRRGAFAGYRWLLLIFLLLAAVQIFLAGFGVFSLNGEQVGAPGETAFDPHRSLGFTLGGVAFIILVLALIARYSARSMVLAAVMFLLVFLAQSLFADLGGSNAFFGGLHAFDGLVILGIAGYLYSLSRRHGA